MKEAEMSEYIAGFNDGYAYVLQEIERNRHLTSDMLLQHLTGQRKEKGPSLKPIWAKERDCD